MLAKSTVTRPTGSSRLAPVSRAAPQLQDARRARTARPASVSPRRARSKEQVLASSISKARTCRLSAEWAMSRTKAALLKLPLGDLDEYSSCSDSWARAASADYRAGCAPAAQPPLVPRVQRRSRIRPAE